jgi:dsDNA-specific endonuclease/ATPase MutS2
MSEREPLEEAAEPEEEFEEVVDIPIDGVLDLHTFRPGEVKDLVPEYLDACLQRGITRVRIIHGKGTGRLRETVRAVLRRHPAVVSFATPPDASGWGATVVTLGEASRGASGDEQEG